MMIFKSQERISGQMRYLMNVFVESKCAIRIGKVE